MASFIERSLLSRALRAIQSFGRKPVLAEMNPLNRLNQNAMSLEAEKARRHLNGDISKRDRTNARTDLIDKMINKLSSPDSSADERLLAYDNATRSIARITDNDMDYRIQQEALATLEKLGLVCRWPSRHTSSYYYS